jgi:hypothetical protein
MRYSDSPLRKIVRLSVLGHRDRDRARLVVDRDFTSAMPVPDASVPAVTSAMWPPRARELLCRPWLIASTSWTRPVRADDHRDAGDELQHRLVRERLESTDRDRAEEHRADANRHVILQRGSAPVPLSPLVTDHV